MARDPTRRRLWTREVSKPFESVGAPASVASMRRTSPRASEAGHSIPPAIDCRGLNRFDGRHRGIAVRWTSGARPG